ncbi:MAG: hypothetical protein Kilf2KO_35390 [Rhodospirillales bacterium]
MSERLCQRCGTELDMDELRCPRCGARTPVIYPWYLPLLSATILLLIAWMLIDFDVVWDYVTGFGQRQ